MATDKGKSIYVPRSAQGVSSMPLSVAPKRGAERSISPTRCACCGRPLHADEIAATSQTAVTTLAWCSACHAGQHFLNLGYTAAEVTTR